jgi:hypothetical protein
MASIVIASDPSLREAEIPVGFPLPIPLILGYTSGRAVVVVEGATVRPFLTETIAMIIFGPLLVIAAIGFFCWLLFTLAVFALPFYAGLMIGIWAFHTGAGWLGGIIVGIIASGVTFGLGQVLLGLVPWTWLRLLIVFAFTVPSVVAGYAATHGIAQIAMPSPTWQMIFSVIGAVAIGVTAFVRFTGMVAPGPAGQGMARG